MRKLIGLLLVTAILIVVYGNGLAPSMRPAAAAESERAAGAATTATAAPTAPATDTTVEENKMDEAANNSPAPRQTTRLLFDFTAAEPAWYTVNDDVMGGVSSSRVTIDTQQQWLTFSGTLSLENNGGFASTRSPWSLHDLAAYDGLLLRVRGDGRVVQLRLRSEKTGPEIAYAAAFATEADEWREVYIPFAEMVPVFRGFLVRDAGPLDPATIRSFGLMVADKQQGEFTLDLDWIQAVKTE